MTPRTVTCCRGCRGCDGKGRHSLPFRVHLQVDFPLWRPNTPQVNLPGRCACLLKPPRHRDPWQQISGRHEVFSVGSGPGGMNVSTGSSTNVQSMVRCPIRHYGPAVRQWCRSRRELPWEVFDLDRRQKASANDARSSVARATRKDSIPLAPLNRWIDGGVPDVRRDHPNRRRTGR